MPSDQAGGMKDHNIFTVESEAVKAAAGGAAEGSALWQDAAWRLHKDRYAAMDVPLCRVGKLPEQCGACCISKAVHPGDNVETFAAKFRYMRSPGEAAGRRLDVVGRAAVQVLKNRSVDP